MATVQTSSLPDVRYFKSLNALSGLSEKYIAYFLENARIKRYGKGKILFLEGDCVTSFYIVRSGWGKLFRNTEDGAEVITNFCKAGDLFSKSSITEESAHLSSAQIVEEAIIYEIPAHILRDAVKKDISLALGILSDLSNSLNTLNKQIEHLSIMSSDQRIGCFFLHLLLYGNHQSSKAKLPCNKEALANYLGMKPETFSRSLPKLKAIGVTVNSNYIEINSAMALRNHTCVSCSSAGACPACPESADSLNKKHMASF